MGYTTEFKGQFTLDRPLTMAQAIYLRKFSGSRRVKRNATKAAGLADTYRNAVGLPIGVEGEFYVASANDGQFGQSSDGSVVNGNTPPSTQPGLWCQWVPTEDGQGIEWDGGEKFYDYVEWFAYICHNFLTPWGYKVSGTVRYRGEEFEDYGSLDGAEIQAKAGAARHPKPVGPQVKEYIVSGTFDVKVSGVSEEDACQQAREMLSGAAGNIEEIERVKVLFEFEDVLEWVGK